MCSLKISSSLAVMFFHRVKEPKRPSQVRKSNKTLLTSCLATSFGRFILAVIVFTQQFREWENSLSTGKHHRQNAPFKHLQFFSSFAADNDCCSHSDGFIKDYQN